MAEIKKARRATQRIGITWKSLETQHSACAICRSAHTTIFLRFSFAAFISTGLLGVIAFCGYWLRPSTQATATVLFPGPPAGAKQAADMLENVMREHDEAALHHAGSVLEAVVDMEERPGGGPLEDKYPIERERDEQQLDAAVRALDKDGYTPVAGDADAFLVLMCESECRD
jgi:hypothetical protein